MRFFGPQKKTYIGLDRLCKSGSHQIQLTIFWRRQLYVSFETPGKKHIPPAPPEMRRHNNCFSMLRIEVSPDWLVHFQSYFQ